VRITHGMLADATLRNLNATMRRLDKLQEQLTSGRRIARISDDPVAATQALGYRTDLSETGQYLRNIDAATVWLNATDAALGSATDLIQRARELAVQGANASLAPQDRLAIANEARQLMEHLVQVGNSTLGTEFLFAGQKTNSPPFAIDLSTLTWAYTGDGGSVTREIGPGAQITVNARGDTVLEPALEALKGLIVGLEANDGVAIQASISSIDSALDNVLVAQLQAGAKANRLEASTTRLEDLRVNQSGLLSKREDVDMVEAISSYAVTESVYKAALSAGSRAIQPSLLDYLH